MKIVVLIPLVFLLSIVLVGAIEYNFPASVTINPVDLEYELSLYVRAITKFLRPGRNLLVYASVSKTDLYDQERDRITVNLTYEILKDDDVLLTGDAGSVQVFKKMTKIIKIYIPEDFELDEYKVRIKASHPQAAEVEAQDYFWVLEFRWQWVFNFFLP